MKTTTRNKIYVFAVLFISAIIPAIILNRWFEAFIFVLCHWFIRIQFPKEYHHVVPEMCRIITACVTFFGICLILPIQYSLFSAIPINYLIAWVGFIKKTSDEFEVKCEELEIEIEQIIIELKRHKNIDLYKMSEEELRQYAQSKGLSEVICDTLVLRVINHYRWVDIERELKFSKDGIRYHKEQIIEKLGFKP